MRRRGLVAALDPGARHVRMVVLEKRPDHTLALLGWSQIESEGLCRGRVVHFEQALESVTQALESAERSCGRNIEEVILGVPGDTLAWAQRRHAVPLGEKPRTILDGDVRRVTEGAEQTAVVFDQKLLHTFINEFQVDDETGIANPIGLMGSRLEIDAQMLIWPVQRQQNWANLLREAGVKLGQAVYQGMALSSALTDEERENGIGGLLVGESNTEWVVFRRGRLETFQSFEFGIGQVCERVAGELRMPAQTARMVMERYGGIDAASCESQREVFVPSFHRESKTLQIAKFNGALRQAVEEIFRPLVGMVQSQASQTRLDRGIAVAGGMGMMDGFGERVEQWLGWPARIALPPSSAGVTQALMSPCWTVAFGLAHWAGSQWLSPPVATGGWLHAKLTRLDEWMAEHF